MLWGLVFLNGTKSPHNVNHDILRWVICFKVSFRFRLGLRLGQAIGNYGLRLVSVSRISVLVNVMSTEVCTCVCVCVCVCVCASVCVSHLTHICDMCQPDKGERL